MSKQTKASIVFVHGGLVGAITAAVTNAQAGLNWLRAEPPDLEEVRQVLNSIASDGMRAAKIAIRLQALEKVPTADDAADP
jgi:isocitrate lyase